MNNKRIKLSIIVPVYKVEEYLEKCISSILNQTLHDFELILIDDGSPDRCPQICDSFASNDNRVIVLHQDNQGVSVARNKGLDIARGEWIGFIDSDDYLKEEAFSELIYKCETNQCDVGIMDFAYVDKDGSIVKKREYGKDEILSKSEVIAKQFDIPLSIRLVMWNKVFRRELLDGLRYDVNLRASEDTLLLHQCLKRCHSAYWLKKPLYMNVQRPGSAMRGALKIQDIALSLDVHKSIKDDIKREFPKIYDKALIHYIDTCIWKMRSQLPVPQNLSSAEIFAYRKEIRSMKRHILKEVFPIITCSAISLKRKIAYLLIGIRG